MARRPIHNTKRAQTNRAATVRERFFSTIRRGIFDRSNSAVRRASPAFTLIELVAALVVMGIILLMTLPDLESSGRTYVLQSGANEVMAALRFAQARAMNTAVKHGCEFSTAANTIRCFVVSGAPPYPTVDHPIKKTPYTLDFDTTPGLGGVTISGATFPGATIIFDSLGAPDNGGTVTVSISGYSKNVNVSAISGLTEFSDP